MSEPFVDEGQVIRDYGATVPDEYGGVYSEAGKLVALFTENLPRHEAALRDLLPFPDHLAVRHAARTWQTIEHSKSEVSRILMGDQRNPAAGVTMVGIGVRDRQFVVVVGVDPLSTETAALVEQLVEPRSVVIQHRTRPHELGASA